MSASYASPPVGTPVAPSTMYVASGMQKESMPGHGVEDSGFVPRHGFLLHHIRRSVHRTRRNRGTYRGTGIQGTHSSQQQINLFKFALGEMFREQVVDGDDVRTVQKRITRTLSSLFSFVLLVTAVTATGGA